MPKFATAKEVRRRLLRDGFSRTYANRAANELREHWEDLVDEGLRAGLVQAEAEAEAEKRIGAAKALAEEICQRMRRSSWLGRYPTFGFAMLALMVTVLWWILLGGAAATFTGVFTEGAPLRIHLLETFFDWVRTTSYVTLPWLCCHVAERYFCGWRPALWACLVLAIHNAMHSIDISGAGVHGNILFGYSFSFGGPALLPILAPLVVFALHRAWMARAQDDPEDSGPRFC